MASELKIRVNERSWTITAAPDTPLLYVLMTEETVVTQERVSTPFTSTEQDPHCASPHPKRGPRS